MNYVLTAEEMRYADNTTSLILGIPSMVLMERAALAVADEITNRFSQKEKICIICGNGNNGGDGYALGRILSERNYNVSIFAAKDSDKLSENNRLQREILTKLGISISTNQPKKEYDIIVDAIFGTGYKKREESGVYDKVLDNINQMKGFKIAMDIPSGLDTDSGRAYSPCVKADLTVTFGFYKRGHFLHDGKLVCGQIVCKDIGISKKAFMEDLPKAYFLKTSDLPTLMPERNPLAHKGTYKKAGIIAGSKEIFGCTALGAKAALYTGVGYVKVLTHKAHSEVLMKHLPESLVYTYQDNSVEDLSDCSAIAIGPGIGTKKEAETLLRDLFHLGNKKLILDADAINLISQSKDLKKQLKTYAQVCDVVLTPHKKELERLLGSPLPSDYKELHVAEQNIAEEYHVYLVCKDAATRVYMPDGTIYINTSGNDGMATAGSGDVLSGILAGFVAGHIDTKTAVALSVFVHGLCGDYASINANRYALKAGDLTDAMKKVLCF